MSSSKASRHRTWLWAVCVGLCSLRPAAGDTVLEDFEAGVQRWITNDINRDVGRGQAVLCSIGRVAGPDTGAGKFGATMTFVRAQSGWASVTLPIDGEELARDRMVALRLWFRGDGSDNEVDLVLRAMPPGRPERKFRVILQLKTTHWTKLEIPLDYFRDEKGPATNAAADFRLLQFVKTGRWDQMFFSIDDVVAVTGQATAPPPPASIVRPGAPLPKPAPKPTPAPPSPGAAPPTRPATPPPTASAKPLTVRADFAHPIGRCSLRLGASLGAMGADALMRPSFREPLKRLSLHWIRVRTSDYLDRDTEPDHRLSFTRLDAALAGVFAIGAKPLVCIDGVGSSTLSADEFVALAGAVARYYLVQQASAVTSFELFHEPLYRAGAADMQTVISTYQRAAAAVRSVSDQAVIGGVGLAAPWASHLRSLIGGETRLDFVSYHFHGAHNISTGESSLMQSAVRVRPVDLPDQADPLQIMQWIQSSASPSARLAITDCALTSMRTPQGRSREPRTRTQFGAAWLATLLARCSRAIDDLLPHGMADPTWGFLNDQDRPLPAYWATWLYQTYAPSGSYICPTTVSAPGVQALAVRTTTSNNLLLVRTAADAVECRVTAAGVGELGFVRARTLEGSASEIQFIRLETAAAQTVRLQGYQVTVVQFVPASSPGATSGAG